MLKVETLIDSPETLPGDAIVHFLFEEETEFPPSLADLNEKLEGGIKELIDSEEAKGKLHESTILFSANRIPARRVLILGAGKRADLTADKVSHLYGQAVRIANGRGWAELIFGATALPAGNLSAEATAQAGAAGVLIGLARSDFYRTSKDKQEDKLKRVVLAGPEGEGWKTAAETGQIIGEGVNLAREMIYQPPADMTPTILAERAKAIGDELGLETTILDKAALEEGGFGALLAVSRGSAQEPRMIRLRYGNFPDKPTLGFVGKGLTFDSGGLNLKSGDGMADMKIDMSGAAAVLGAMHIIGRLKPEINVVGVCPATENIPGPSSYKPGDVVRTLNGKTIEILNTDAEGRVILADGLTYAQQSGATHIVDLATLTGACVVALGMHCVGAMGDPQDWIDRVLGAAKEASETMWQLPLFDEYKEQIKSDIADVKNSGGRGAGAQTGALLLKEFIEEKTAWAHLDIAGPAWSTSDASYQAKGATGVGVKTLYQLALSMSKESGNPA